MTIFLCGFMGCGKTTVGKLLAQIMNRDFIDMDEYIQKKAGRSIPEIFAEKGEDYFREIESRAVKELALTGNVVACGGGAMLKSKNAKAAAENGIVVYMEENFETCYERIRNDPCRPIAVNNTKESLNGIYSDRVPVYEANSQIKIKCKASPAETAEIIRNELGSFTFQS